MADGPDNGGDRTPSYWTYGEQRMGEGDVETGVYRATGAPTGAGQWQTETVRHGEGDTSTRQVWYPAPEPPPAAAPAPTAPPPPPPPKYGEPGYVKEATNVQRANIDRTSYYDPTQASLALGADYLATRNASNPQPLGSTGAGAVGYDLPDGSFSTNIYGD